jgi:threonylcarbamoyladenosine tRNA methylthiotransferase MtaB
VEEKDSANTQKRVAFHTLGCRLNFAESGSLAQGFVDRGYQVVPFGEESDVVFLNTCTVTDGADSTCRNLIRKAYRSSPEAKIVVAGCYAQMESEKISKMEGVDLVLGTSEKYKVFDYLNEADASEQQLIKVDKALAFHGAATSEADDGHTRAFLKIQDGCNYICSFCIIPQARGRSRAIALEDALSEARRVIASGHKEIVLTGVNIGEYEAASGHKLSTLVAKLLELDGLERLRLGSVEPNTLSDDLLDVLKSSPKSLDHFHIPLQSGDDELLVKMRRKYTSDQYRKLIEKIVTLFPNAGIGADVIVGHPGESEAAFQNTFNLLRDLPITHFHVFPFSKRKGTISAKMEDQIQHGVKKERVRALIMLGEAKLALFASDQVGKRNSVLFEKQNPETGLWQGLTSNYLKVEAESPADLKNQVREVYLESAQGERLRGHILQ